jgi:scyllo-inositol 2-dehydrogenase (NADP+)
MERGVCFDHDELAVVGVYHYQGFFALVGTILTCRLTLCYDAFERLMMIGVGNALIGGQMMVKLKVGIAGWGLAARCFHAPFITTDPRFELVYVVTSRPIDHDRWPSLRVLPDFASLLQQDLDVIVIATPHFLHVEQTAQALQAGYHVVVEKPLASRPAEIYALIELATACKRQVFPFQNRRWDSDFLTVQQLLAQGRLGRLFRYEARWDYYRPQVRATWKNNPDQMGGVLYDLGPHLIDQAIVLLGKPNRVLAQITTHHPQRTVEDFFRIELLYPNQLTAVLEVNCFNALTPARYQLHGELGSFEKYGMDPQEARLRAGEWPTQANWGQEPTQFWGRVYSPDGNGAILTETIPSLAGNYGEFYMRVYQTLNQNRPAPVSLQEVALQLEIIEKARQSAQHRQSIGW